MKIIQILNSAHKNQQSSKHISIESIVLPPCIEWIDYRKIISALVAIPVMNSLTQDKFRLHEPYAILRWEYPDGNFIECVTLQSSDKMVELDIPYKKYAAKYIKLCDQLDSNINNFNESILAEIIPDKLIKKYNFR